MATWSDKLLLKVVNVLVYIFLFGSNIYTSLIPEYGHHHHHYYTAKLTHITPAPYAFYVWTVINLGLLGFVILQFFDAGYELAVEHVGWRFAIVGILNAIYAHLYATNHFVAAFILSLFLASAVSHVYWSLRSHPPKGAAQVLCVGLPFSFWHAWSIVLVIITAFAAFGKPQDSHAGIWTKLLVAVALVFLTLTSVGYAFNGDQGDIGGAAVIAWALLGIFSAQRYPEFIHWFALGSFIVSVFAVLKAAYTFYAGGRGGLLTDPERAPLISGDT
jgi:hypothetical protein